MVLRTSPNKEESLVKLIGVLLVFVGWLLPILTLSAVQSTGGRLFLSLLGIAITLVGILGVLNKLHLKSAIWKV